MSRNIHIIGGGLSGCEVAHQLSLNKINSSNLIKKASQVHKIHKARSVTIAIARFE